MGRTCLTIGLVRLFCDMNSRLAAVTKQQLRVEPELRAARLADARDAFQGCGVELKDACQVAEIPTRIVDTLGSTQDPRRGAFDQCSAWLRPFSLTT